MKNKHNGQNLVLSKLIPCIVMVVISIAFIIFFNENNPFDYNSPIYSNKPLTKDGFFFDTYVSLTIYDSSSNYSEKIKTTDDIYTLLDTCLGMCVKYENIFSRTLVSSELYMLIHNKDYISNHSIKVSDSLYECISKTLEYSTVFDNRYSILSGRLCDLWDYNNKKVPDITDITNCVEAMNSYELLVDDNHIKLEQINPSNIDFLPTVNLGASAKGYITDKICTYLKENGIQDAIVDLGGNIYVIGDKYDNTMYNIGIKKPFSVSNEPYAICKVAENAVVTSGIYERYFEINNTIYHHIIDCSTGYPTDNDILSVTIIADNALLADCYSTGCLLLGSNDAISFINSIKEVECIIINKDYDIILSDGLKYKDNYIVLNDFN